MNAFVKAAAQPTEARTENGMKQLSKTGSALVDLFGKIASARKSDLSGLFSAAMAEDPRLTARILLWARDVREGAGERETVRKLIGVLEKQDRDLALDVMKKLPELGRWDDLLFSFKELESEAYKLFANALMNGDGLAAKWSPREKSTKKLQAAKLRKVLGLDAKSYRKLIADLSSTVEQQMSAKKWSEVNYSHVPSVAANRYKRAFARNDAVRYNEYLTELSKPAETRDPEVKINASAIFPHDIVHNVFVGDERAANAQWDALPNYVGNAKMLPIVDTSGSMFTKLAGGVTALEVAISLGLYFSDKNLGPFKDVYLTFSDRSEINVLKGTLSQKILQMRDDNKWGGSTNLHSAFEKILDLAVKNDVPQEDMPDYLIIFSDMQFNYCVRHDDSAIQMIRRKYEEAGYNIPNVIFWNLIDRNSGSPVSSGENGTALVSGFSPSLAKSILETDKDDFNPYSMMMKTIMKPRYDI